MVNKKKCNNNLNFNLAYEKLFMPEIFTVQSNYTLGRAFAISNEQLAQVFGSLNLEGKRVLTVGSSGDQALNAILRGSKDITIIDANIFAKFFIEYKIAAIKTFDYKTFKQIFIRNEFFSWRVYSKISHLLSKDVQIFWDSLMLDLSEDAYGYDFSPKTIKEKMLLVDHRDRFSAFYHSEYEYNKLQSLLNKNNINISYITAELKQFPKVLKNKYHLIYLSNIFDYYKGEKIGVFEQIINKLYQNNLETNGVFLINYSFNATVENSPEQVAGHSVKYLPIHRFADGEMNQDVAWLIDKKPTASENEICR